MKSLEALAKNFKLLFRSKETAFTIIFGPLLIILLVGFAFSGSDDLKISLGAYAENGTYTPLTDSIIESLTDDYIVNIYASGEECVEKVQAGTDQMCLIFPQDFEVRENHSNVVTFNVDPSRINLVYAVIDQLGTEFNFQSSALSMDLTNTILTRLSTTKGVLDEQADNAKLAQELRTLTEQKLTSTQGKMQVNNLNFSYIDLKDIRGRATGIETDAKQIYDLSSDQLGEAISVLHQLKSDADNATVEKIEVAIDEFENAQTLIDGIYEESPGKLESIYYQIDRASSAVTALEQEYDTLKDDSVYVEEQIDKSISHLQDMKGLLTRIQGSLEYTNEMLSEIKIADASSIVSPITTTINPVTSERGNLTFTYPYVLMLVIMFMGIMLGSTLIVADKKSNAAFRNFTTSTRDGFHIAMSFITTLLILCAQVAIILLFSSLLVTTPLLSNFGTTILVILLAITLFSFLGMTLGYLSKSQEAAMISSLTLGSVMLFISNLVIPIEGMNTLIRVFTAVNPYVVLGEMLKKSMLFGTSITEFGIQLALVFGLAFFLLILVVLVQRYVRSRYFKEQAAVEVKVKKSAKPLDIGGRIVTNEYELLTTLDLMTRAQFAELVNEKVNPIYIWVKNELENKKLAAKLKTVSKERMIIRLDKHLKRATKKAAKK